MYKELFLFLLLIHIIGDFYLQSDSLADKKNYHYPALVVHSITYLLVSFVICIPVFSITIVIVVSILSLSHFIIDSIKYIFIRVQIIKDGDRNRVVFISDQILHILCIIIICILFEMEKQSFAALPLINSIFSIIGISQYRVLCWLVLLLLIWKPANIIIKKLLLNYKPDSSEEQLSKKSGAFIGILERLIILVLLSIQQYAAIGLVLTAKSVARYNKISENKDFAEYYLLGTLLSTAMVIIAYLVIF